MITDGTTRAPRLAGMLPRCSGVVRVIDGIMRRQSKDLGDPLKVGIVAGDHDVAVHGTVKP